MPTKYAQPILFFFCRPCGDYHSKTHPHYAEQLARAKARRIAKAAKVQEAKKKGQRKGKKASPDSPLA
jgi:sRNA-binding protein